MWYFGWLFIALIAFSSLGCFVSERYNKYDFLNIISHLILIFSFICWIIMLMWDLSENRKLDSYNENTVIADTTFIKSASLNSELHGIFMLGCGSIDETDVYKFYEVVDSNSFKIMTLPVAKTRIQEVELDSTFVPHVVSYYYTDGYIIHGWFYRSMLNRSEREDFHNIKHLKEHVIYVPKRTIVGDLSKLNL